MIWLPWLFIALTMIAVVVLAISIPFLIRADRRKGEREGWTREDGYGI